MAQDLLISQDMSGAPFDISVDGTDLATVDGLETTIAVLLFSDARAAAEQVPDPLRRRGWVGNIVRETELGGLLWLAEQTRNTKTIQNKIRGWAQDSLTPLITEGFASDILVSVGQDDPRGMKLGIQIRTKDDNTKAFDFWLKTDLGNL